MRVARPAWHDARVAVVEHIMERSAIGHGSVVLTGVPVGHRPRVEPNLWVLHREGFPRGPDPRTKNPRCTESCLPNATTGAQETGRGSILQGCAVATSSSTGRRQQRLLSWTFAETVVVLQQLCPSSSRSPTEVLVEDVKSLAFPRKNTLVPRGMTRNVEEGKGNKKRSWNATEEKALHNKRPSFEPVGQTNSTLHPLQGENQSLPSRRFLSSRGSRPLAVESLLLACGSIRVSVQTIQLAKVTGMQTRTLSHLSEYTARRDYWGTRRGRSCRNIARYSTRPVTPRRNCIGSIRTRIFRLHLVTSCQCTPRGSPLGHLALTRGSISSARDLCRKNAGIDTRRTLRSSEPQQQCFARRHWGSEPSRHPFSY